MSHQGSGLLKRLVVATLSLLAIAFFAIGCSSKSDTAKAEAGTCIKINKASSTDADTEPIDCSKDEAVYKIFSTNDKKTDCPSEQYTTYTETSGKDTVAYLCLYENLKQDNCYKQDSATNVFENIACTDPTAKFKVTQKIDGSDDPTVCPEGEANALAFSDPKLTYCFGDPKA
jgi:hypothetical protein